MLGEVGQLGTHNMYAYCANTPVMYLDITGEYAVENWLLNTKEQENVAPNLLNYISIYGIYFSLYLGGENTIIRDQSNRISAGIGIGVTSVSLNTGKIFNSSGPLDLDLGLTFNIIKASAEVAFDFEKGIGFEAGIELFSLEGSLMITDTLGIKAEIRLGAEVAFYIGANSTEISIIWWSVKIVY